ncbi:MAG TPA: patatin-like phospholipase family protein [Oligoflexia bacterium]|nr:patatin-like phospholipase family protein [Oligoflexia bacterium]HMR24983.1 patatin-like phospholipase family protein [Oligoflexia bacterium]
MAWWSSNPKNVPAVVLSGGGTRGAYEAGVIHYIRTGLPPKLAKKLNFKVQVGASVGSINAAFMASHAHDPIAQGQLLRDLWSNIRSEDIYKRGPITSSKFLIQSSFGAFAKLFGVKDLYKEDDKKLDFSSLFNTKPFQSFLTKNCSFQTIPQNIKKGLIQAVAVSATNLSTGQVEIFVDKHPDLTFDYNSDFRFQKITARHVMASAALPVLFPPVTINGTYYNDGGLRLRTPLKPALSLGSNMILVIGTSSAAEEEENSQPSISETESEEYVPRPGIGDIMGKLLEAALIDRLEADIQNVYKINKIHDVSKKLLSEKDYADFCQSTNTRPIQLLNIEPSINISKLVDDQLKYSFKSLQSIGTIERAILKLLEIDEKRGTEFLSYFLFEPTFINQLLRLGYNDAKAKHDELCDFAEKAIL